MRSRSVDYSRWSYQPQPLYTMGHTAAEVAKWFNVAAEPGNAGGENYPGCSG
jgi:hypothetical protein